MVGSIVVNGNITWDNVREGYEVVLYSPDRIEEIHVGSGGGTPWGV